MKSKRTIDSSGNVFADLGLPNPEQELIKAKVTLKSIASLSSAA